MGAGPLQAAGHRVYARRARAHERGPRVRLREHEARADEHQLVSIGQLTSTQSTHFNTVDPQRAQEHPLGEGRRLSCEGAALQVCQTTDQVVSPRLFSSLAPYQQLNRRALSRGAVAPLLFSNNLRHNLVIGHHTGLERVEHELDAVVHIRRLHHELRGVALELAFLVVAFRSLEVELDVRNQGYVSERRGLHLVGQDFACGLDRGVVSRVDVASLVLHEARRLVGAGLPGEHEECSRGSTTCVKSLDSGSRIRIFAVREAEANLGLSGSGDSCPSVGGEPRTGAVLSGSGDENFRSITFDPDGNRWIHWKSMDSKGNRSKIREFQENLFCQKC